MSIEVAISEGQRCLKDFPVIVLGSGASIPFGLPSMDTLANHLLDSMQEGTLVDSEKDQWERFKTTLSSQDLESALQAIFLSERLSDYIIEQTWRLINTADLSVLEAALDNNALIPLTRLFRYLFDSTHRTLSVVTTNYDRLAEYAADLSSACQYTGFSFGQIRRRQSNSRLIITENGHQSRTVDIWKVHGSLDWFRHDNGNVIALNSARSIPNKYRPAIVTPGVEKYELTHLEPFRSIIKGADRAIAKARAYLCIGFGFNDSHIQPKLLERWHDGEAFLVVLSKELTDAARNMLSRANGQEYLALEEAPNGTRMWSHDHPEGQVLEENGLWRLSEFLKATID